MITPESISLAALIVTLLAMTAFIVMTHLWTRWYTNPWGRHVMIFGSTMILILTFGLARVVFGDYPGRAWVLAALYVGLAGTACQRAWLVFRAHRRYGNDNEYVDH